MNQIKSDAQAGIEAMEKYHEAKVITIPRPVPGSDIPVLLVPNGFQAMQTKPMLDAFLARPERIKGTARFEHLGSFIEYTKKFSNMHSKLFATGGKNESGLPNPKLLAVYDHHHASDTKQAEFGEHRGVYGFPLADEFVAWWNQDEVSMDQEKFAAFLEDRLLDVIDPSQASPEDRAAAEQIGHKLAIPGKLLSLSKGLSISVDHKVTQRTDLKSQQKQIVFHEQHNDEEGQPLDVPGAFAIAVRVFEGDVNRTAMLVRLRYKVQGQKIVWSFQLYQPERVFHDAFTRLCDRAQEQTALPLFYGSPETA